MTGSQSATAKAGIAEVLKKLAVRYPYLHGIGVALVDLGWYGYDHLAPPENLDDEAALLGWAGDLDYCILTHAGTDLRPREVDALRVAILLLQTRAAMVAWVELTP